MSSIFVKNKFTISFFYSILVFLLMTFVFSIFLFLEVHAARFLVLSYLERRTGLKIQYETISPHFLSSLKIDNLELSLNEKDKVSFKTVIINLDLFGLISGNKDIILKIIVKGSDLSFNLEDFILLSQNSSLEGQDEKREVESIVLDKIFDDFNKLNIELEDINFKLKLNENNSLNFKIQNFSLKTIDEDFLISSVIDFDLFANSDLKDIESLNSTFYLEGKFRKKLDTGYINVSFFEFKSTFFSLLEQAVQVNYSNGNIKVFNIYRENLDLNLNYDKDKKSLRLDALFLNVNLLNWIKLNGELEDYKDYLDINLNGQLALSYDFITYDLRYATLIDSSSNSETTLKELQGLKIQFKGNNEVINIQNSFFKLKRGFINYKGYYSLTDLLPRGRLEFKSANILKIKELNGYLDFSKKKDNFLVYSNNFKIGHLEVQNLNLNTKFLENEIAIDYSIAFKNNHSKMYAKGGFYSDHISLNVDIKEFPLLFLKETLPEISFVKAIPSSIFSGKYLSTSSSFYLNKSDFKKNKLTSLNFLIYSKLSDFNFSFTANGENELYKINNLQYISNEYNVSTSPIVLKVGNDELNLNTYFKYLNKTYPLTINLDTKNSYLDITSSNDVKFSLNYGLNSNINYSLNINNFYFYNKDSNVLINIKSSGNYLADNNVINGNIDKFKISKVSKNKVDNFDFSFNGTFDNNLLKISEIRFINAYSNLQGYGGFNFKERIDGTFNLFSSLNSERYFLGINSDEDGSYLLFRFQGMDFENFNALSFLKGKLGGNLILNFKENDLFNYSLNGSLNTESAVMLGRETDISFNIGLVDNKFNIYNLKFDQDKKNIITGNFRYDFGSLIGVSSLDFNNELFSTRISTNFQNFENKAEESLGILKNETEGELSFKEMKYKNKKLSDLTIDFNNTIDRLRVFSVEYDLINVLYTYNNGEFNISLMDYLPVSFNAHGKISKDNKILGRVEDIKFDSKIITEDFLKTKSLFNTSDHFVLYDINATGNLDVEGDLFNPNLNGSLNVLKGSISTEYLKTSKQFGNTKILQIENMEALVEDNKVLFNRKFNIEYGTEIDVKTSLNLNFSSDTIVDYYIVDIKVLGDVGAPINFDKIAVNALGDVNGNFIIQGNSEEIMFKGNLNISNASVYLIESSIINLLINPFRNLKDQKKSDIYEEDFDIATDLEISFGSGVTFYWPDDKIPILQATLARENKLIIKSDTKTNDFIVKGDLNIANGTVSYNSKKFIFKKGAYVSLNENKSKFDPWIKAEATATIKDKNDNLLITMSVDNPLSLFKINLSSYPSRSEQEINYLLSASIIGIDLEESQTLGINTAKTAIGFLSDVAVDFLIQPVEDYIRAMLNLDLLTIKTDIIKNAINSNVSLSNPTFVDILDNTSIKVGKYVSEGVFVNGGFILSKDEITPFSKNLNFVTNFGIEFDSPFFLINWDFDYNFMKSGLEGIGSNISISWKLKY